MKATLGILEVLLVGLVGDRESEEESTKLRVEAGTRASTTIIVEEIL